jgi:hypothetical protein
MYVVLLGPRGCAASSNVFARRTQDDAVGWHGVPAVDIYSSASEILKVGSQ